MKPLSHSLEYSARLAAFAAMAGLFLFGMNAQALTHGSSKPAPTPPPTIAAVPTYAAAKAPSTMEEDIRDIGPPFHIPLGWLWLAWTASGLALAALGYGAWWWRHRLGGRVKLPYELALGQLEEARRLMQPDQARAFSIAVSEVVRNYIEECFAVRAAHRTTEKFLRDLATCPGSPLVAHQRVLAEFLRHCDLAKFTRWILSVPQMDVMLQSASAFIVATAKPVSEEHNSPAHSVRASAPPTSRRGSAGCAGFASRQCPCGIGVTFRNS